VVLHGRDVERLRLAALTLGARQGRAGVLMVLGEPGVGKSALLDELTSSAADQGMRVLRTVGLESESPLAFGALHRLMRPVMRLMDRLPAPQARALQVALGQLESPFIEPFLVGVATLSLLTEAAEESPVLCVIDDAHWLDTASADALLFAARRLDADRVAMVFAARDTEASAFSAEGIETLTVAGLGPDAMRALLTERVGTGIPEEVAQRMLAETGGNPLALVELPANLTAAQLNGTTPLPARLMVGANVERVFLDRLRRLPRPVHALMLVVAADDTGQLATTRQAAASLGADLAAWDEAERSGLLSIEGDTVRVRHPLVRSAVYQAATSLQRRQVHQTIADALSVASSDPDREAWHRAAAVDGGMKRSPRTSCGSARVRRTAAVTPAPPPRTNAPPSSVRTRSCARSDCLPPPAMRGRPAMRPERPRCPPGHASKPTIRCCAPTPTGSAAGSRSTSGHPRQRIGSSPRPPELWPESTRSGRWRWLSRRP
jgi:hypothetical protein